MNAADVLKVMLDGAWLLGAALMLRTAVRAAGTRHRRLLVASILGAATCAVELGVVNSPTWFPLQSLIALGMVLATIAAFIVALAGSPADAPGGLIGFVLVLVVVGPIVAHALEGGFESHDAPGIAQGASHHRVLV